MKDKNDLQTIDLISKPGRGRPRTSNPEKKKKDAAARAKRHREKLKSSPRRSDDKINSALYFLYQEFRWMECHFLEDGNFDDKHGLDWAIKSASGHRDEALKHMLNLCKLLDEKELEKRIESSWGEIIEKLEPAEYMRDVT